MRKRFTKFAQVAGIMLALIFTFSCSSGDDGNNNGGGGSSVTGGADGGGNQFSQIYNGYYDENDVYHVGTAYNGSGFIKILAYDENDNEVSINAGSVTNGIVKLELPQTIPNEYLSKSFLDKIATTYCTDYINDIKEFIGRLVLTDNNGTTLGELAMQYQEGSIIEVIDYSYYTKAGKITCDYNKGAGRDIYKFDVKVGWNKIYCHNNYANGNRTKECNTKNILTKEKEMKWTLQED